MARVTGPRRRELILEAAQEAFAAQGYEATSVREICEAAGISKPVLYDHFPSKERLFAELLEKISGDMTRLAADAMAADAPAEARVRGSLDAFFAYVEARPSAVRVLFVMPRGGPKLAATARRVQAGVTAELVEILDAERLLPGVRNRRRRLELLGEFVKHGTNGLAEWWIDHPGVKRKELVDVAMSIVWDGLAAQMAPRRK